MAPPKFRGVWVYRVSGPVFRDTARLSQRYPPIARYGVFGVSTWPIGCDTPSPFSERFPLGEHAEWRCDNPPPLSSKCLSVSRRPRTVGSEVLMQDRLCRCTCVCALFSDARKGGALFYLGKC